jgi:hypothetical protein
MIMLELAPTDGMKTAWPACLTFTTISVLPWR